MKCACESCACRLSRTLAINALRSSSQAGSTVTLEACTRAGYADESAHLNAYRLRANESVAARIEELSARNAEKCQLSRDEAVQYLVEILKTPIAEVTADHRPEQFRDAKSRQIAFAVRHMRASLIQSVFRLLTAISVGPEKPRSTLRSLKSQRSNAP
jgi:terminase small subunit-like protein